MNQDNEQFGTPKVAQATPSAGFAPEGRVRDAGQGMAWLGAAWDLFKRAPGIWIALILIYLLLAVVLGFIPMIGQLALTLLGPVFMGGIFLGCKALDDGDELRIEHLFAGFQGKLAPLAMLGVVYLGGLIVIGLVVFGLGAMLFGVNVLANIGWAGNAESANMGAMFMSFMILVCVAMLMVLPLAMAMWFAPALVVFHDMQPIAAMRSSLFASIKNVLPMLIFGLLLLVLGIVATIPFGLGWLILLPVLMASTYTAYRDIYIQA